jgi:hypothetical protein
VLSQGIANWKEKVPSVEKGLQIDIDQHFKSLPSGIPEGCRYQPIGFFTRLQSIIILSVAGVEEQGGRNF